MLSMPVTTTSVVVPTATATCNIPPDAASPAARRIVLRRMGKLWAFTGRSVRCRAWARQSYGRLLPAT